VSVTAKPGKNLPIGVVDTTKIVTTYAETMLFDRFIGTLGIHGNGVLIGFRHRFGVMWLDHRR